MRKKGQGKTKGHHAVLQRSGQTSLPAYFISYHYQGYAFILTSCCNSQQLNPQAGFHKSDDVIP